LYDDPQGLREFGQRDPIESTECPDTNHVCANRECGRPSGTGSRNKVTIHLDLILEWMPETGLPADEQKRHISTCDSGHRPPRSGGNRNSFGPVGGVVGQFEFLQRLDSCVPYSLFPKPNARAILPAIVVPWPSGAGLLSVS